MRNKILSILKLENMTYVSQFHYIMLLVGTITMVITYRFSDSSTLSVVSGFFGLFSVLLCSDKKVAFYLFGFAQLMTYVILCLEQRLYGEVAENIFYFVTMIYGLYHWIKYYNYDEAKVEPRRMSSIQNQVVGILTIAGTVVLYYILKYTDDTQPFMDSITTIPAFIAQILMILRYRESWLYWFIIDVGSIVMWAVAGDWCMVAQFVFWTINCIYGFINWSKI